MDATKLLTEQNISVDQDFTYSLMETRKPFLLSAQTCCEKQNRTEKLYDIIDTPIRDFCVCHTTLSSVVTGHIYQGGQ